jgi:hypothetical protein
MKITLLTLLVVMCSSTISIAQGDGPPLAFVELNHGVYTFTRGAVVVKASCDYSITYRLNGHEMKTEHFCPLNQLPGDTILEGGLLQKASEGDRYSLSNEYIAVMSYQYCTSGEGCIDHLRISQEVWFHIISMKKGKAT